MGRLAGFKYRPIVKRLKQLGSSCSTGRPQAVTKSGTTQIHTNTPPSQIIPAICPRAHCAPSSNSPAWSRKNFYGINNHGCNSLWSNGANWWHTNCPPTNARALSVASERIIRKLVLILISLTGIVRRRHDSPACELEVRVSSSPTPT